MRNFVICLSTLLLSVACNQQNADLSEVEVFINNLKEGKIETFETVDFGSEDVSELLEYSDDAATISTFPRNPLSSFYLDEVNLGIYVLWIVESIRMEEINDPDFYLYASLTPRIFRVSTGELVDQDTIQADIYEAYREWWNSGLAVEERVQIKPLEDLDLAWN